jgi:hypothetical protein
VNSNRHYEKAAGRRSKPVNAGTNDEIATAACGVLAKTGTHDEFATAAFGVLAKTGR